MKLNLGYAQTPWRALNKKYDIQTCIWFPKATQKIKDPCLMFNIIHHAVMEGLNRADQWANCNFYNGIKKQRDQQKLR